MKTNIKFLMACVACMAATASPGAETAKETTAAAVPGVKGTVYRIDGTKQPTSKVTCSRHDLVEIDFTYPITPPAFPTKATQHSSHPAIVKPSGIHQVIQVGGLLGTGQLGALFVAEKHGHAELTFTIVQKAGKKVLKCEVEVK